MFKSSMQFCLPFLGSLRQWHWISSALCLAGMLLFAATGITLNHAGQIEASPRVTTIEEELPSEIIMLAQNHQQSLGDTIAAPLPALLQQWLRDEHGIRTGDRIAEWSEDEVYLSMPRPGGDAWLSLDFSFGELIYENTSRGVISYLNDLHKARNTGLAWSWFIDLFSVVCVVFSLTGLLLLIRQQRSRPMTWPITGLGLLIPVLLALLFIHN